MKQTTTQFDFSAKPKVTAHKPKYRQRDQQRIEGSSLMNDPRIIRGNTYAALIANKNQIHPPPQAKKQVKEAPHKMKERRINFDTGFEPTTPRAVSGRDHFTTQTQPFVQTLRDKPIQYEKQSQTDLFLDRPVERLFNPMDGKTGADRSTQIQENDPDLFNFDYEAQPILDALLNKVLETSRMQLYEEEQLRLKQKQKIEYEKRRHARLVQAQKQESNEDRLKDEYDRRQLQYRKSNQQQCFAQKKIISRILSKQYLKNLRENTEVVLEHEGFFRHPLQIDLYETYVPWLYGEIVSELQKQQQFTRLTEEMAEQAERQQIEAAEIPIKQQKDRIKAKERELYEKKQARIARKKEKEEERKRKQAEEEEERRRIEAQNAENEEKKEQQVKEDGS